MAPIASSYFALIPPFLLALLSLFLWGSWWVQRRNIYLLWMGACCALASVPYGWQVLLPTARLASWAPLLSLLYFFSVFCWVQATTTRFRVRQSMPVVWWIFAALMTINMFFARYVDHIGIRVAALCILLAALVMQPTMRLLRAPPRGKLELSIVAVHMSFGLFLMLRPVLFMPEGGHLAHHLAMRDTLFWWVTVAGSLVFCMLQGGLMLASSVQGAIDQLHQERNQDPLTSLLNRRGFNEAASQATRRKQGNRNHTVVVCDLDHFKHVNDRWGHAQGDRVLQAFATQLRAGTRDSDVVARFGGEEFVLLMLDVHPTQALPLLERLRQQFHAHTFTTLQGSFQVSASFGAAPFLPDDTLESVLQRADIQLYQAKQNGRNRICIDAPAHAKLT